MSIQTVFDLLECGVTVSTSHSDLIIKVVHRVGREGGRERGRERERVRAGEKGRERDR